MTDQEKIELLATKVMGWKKEYIELKHKPEFASWDIADDFWLGENEPRHICRVSDWNPLENIADAWMVLERLVDSEYPISLTTYTDPDTRRVMWEADFNDTFGEGTAPQAICEAALKVIKE